METIKCKITSISNNEQLNLILKNWTYAFHRVFNDYAKHGDKYISSKEYSNVLVNNFNLTYKEIEHLKIQVKEKIEQCNTRFEQLKTKRDSLQKNISDKYTFDNIENYKKEDKKAVIYYRDVKKLNRLDKQLSYFEKNPYRIVFGGKLLLQKISYISNLVKIATKEEWRNVAIYELRKNQPNRVLNEKDINNKICALKEELKKLPFLKEEYKRKRVIPYYSVGNSGKNGGKENCNIQFSLFLKERYAIFKPNRKTKIRIDFVSCDKDLDILDKANKNKQLPITVTLSDSNICFSFDTFKLHNQLSPFNKKDANNSKNKIKDELTTIYNSKNKKYVAAVDLNPQEIGFSVIKILSNNEFKVVKAYNFSLKKIRLIKNEKSTSNKYKKTANILKIEQGFICKKIASILKYYNVGIFIMDNVENLSSKGDSSRNKKINRLFTQVWHKDRIMFLLKKHCDKNAIKVYDKIPNAYTSIIGNISYPYYDSVNAAIDLARRGAIKVINNNFSPKEYYELDNNDKKNIKVFLELKTLKSRTQSDVSVVDSFSTWEEFAAFLKKQDLYKGYRNKEPLTCCGYNRGMGYNSISRIEKYYSTNIIYPLAKLFSSCENDVNSLKTNIL